MSELLHSATAAVEMARNAGAQDAWASLSRDRSVSYTFRDGKIEKVEESTSRGLGISLYVDDRYSTHSPSVMPFVDAQDRHQTIALPATLMRISSRPEDSSRCGPRWSIRPLSKTSTFDGVTTGEW